MLVEQNTLWSPTKETEHWWLNPLDGPGPWPWKHPRGKNAALPFRIYLALSGDIFDTSTLQHQFSMLASDQSYYYSYAENLGVMWYVVNSNQPFSDTPGVGGKLNLDLKQVEQHLRRELSRCQWFEGRMADCVSKNGGPDIHKAPPPQVRGTCFLCHF